LKYAIVFLVIIFGVWLWRQRRDDASASIKSSAKPSTTPAPGVPTGPAQIMVSCAACGVHLPMSEAIASRKIHFCSAEHQQQYQRER
jgi:uncharacterized protein